MTQAIRLTGGDPARQGDAQKMLALVEKMVTQGGVTRQEVRKETSKQKAGRPKSFTFSFRPPAKNFNLRMSFKKGRVDKSEIIEALENIIKELKSSR